MANQYYEFVQFLGILSIPRTFESVKILIEYIITDQGKIEFPDLKRGVESIYYNDFKKIVIKQILFNIKTTDGYSFLDDNEKQILINRLEKYILLQ